MSAAVVHDLLVGFRRTANPHFLLRRRFPFLPRPTPLFSTLPGTSLTLAAASDESPFSPSDDRSGPTHGGGGHAPTIAAIITSLGAGPAAVGIVRLSGGSAVDVAGRVFRPAGRKAEGDFGWRPRSHFVEYGVAVDGRGVVIDEKFKDGNVLRHVDLLDILFKGNATVGDSAPSTISKSRTSIIETLDKEVEVQSISKEKMTSSQDQPSKRKKTTNEERLNVVMDAITTKVDLMKELSNERKQKEALF